MESENLTIEDLEKAMKYVKSNPICDGNHDFENTTGVCWGCNKFWVSNQQRQELKESFNI